MKAASEAASRTAELVQRVIAVEMFLWHWPEFVRFSAFLSTTTREGRSRRRNDVRSAIELQKSYGRLRRLDYASSPPFVSLRNCWRHVASLAALACSDSTHVSQQDQDLASLRQAVAGIENLPAAQAAGYTTVAADPTDGHTCFSDPSGGMGIHYLNTTLVDDTVIVTKPELMIYEPQQDGSMTFVGVEYIIPHPTHG